MAAPAPAPAPPMAAPRVGLLYDDRMCAHATPDGEEHPENPERLRAIWRKLNAAGVASRYGARGRSPAPLCRAESVVVFVGMGEACTAHPVPSVFIFPFELPGTKRKPPPLVRHGFYLFSLCCCCGRTISI